MDPCHGRWAAWLDELWAGDVRNVLDVCCGTGLLAAELTARGYRVTGVDSSAMLSFTKVLTLAEQRDLPVLFTATAYILLNLVADVAYMLVDPRIRVS